jgi:KaiC/GvpD/RAD55 family RecA-like ATPase
MKKLEVTIICIAQKIEGKAGDTTDNVIEFKGDSLTLLDFVEVGDEITRTVKVKKMRKTNINGLTHPFEFTQNGVVVKRKEV